ncbi:MAG TPA: DUF3185 family protein [Verrucomicrobiae bacterium]|jgi:predicted benzoate:H+ symporter BenE|nr:DUF3185 family protein [Verrucomicrobiae bacterium]
MNKALSIGVLIAGVVLIVFGVSASNSFGSSVSRAFTGAPTDKAVWMLVGGIIMAVAGLVFTLRGSRNG